MVEGSEAVSGTNVAAPEGGVVAGESPGVGAVEGPGPGATPGAGARRLGPWASILGAIVVFVALLGAATLASLSGRPAPHIDAGSPAATVQAWIDAVEAGDYATADEYLSQNLRSRGMTSESLDMAGFDVSVGASTVSGDTATVAVTISLPMSSFSMPETFTLIREDGAWKIDDFYGSSNARVAAPAAA